MFSGWGSWPNFGLYSLNGERAGFLDKPLGLVDCHPVWNSILRSKQPTFFAPTERVFGSIILLSWPSPEPGGWYRWLVYIYWIWTCLDYPTSSVCLLWSRQIFPEFPCQESCSSAWSGSVIGTGTPQGAVYLLSFNSETWFIMGRRTSSQIWVQMPYMGPKSSGSALTWRISSVTQNNCCTSCSTQTGCLVSSSCEVVGWSIRSDPSIVGRILEIQGIIGFGWCSLVLAIWKLLSPQLCTFISGCLRW